VADVREPLAAVSGLTEPEEVDFTVRAYDAAGNVSEPSAPVRWLTWRFDMPGYLGGLADGEPGGLSAGCRRLAAVRHRRERLLCHLPAASGRHLPIPLPSHPYA